MALHPAPPRAMAEQPGRAGSPPNRADARLSELLDYNNWFQGGLGKDTFSGGSGCDLYDLNAVAESGVGTTKRDVIKDFDHLVDDVDLMGIDADTSIAGN